MLTNSQCCSVDVGAFKWQFTVNSMPAAAVAAASLEPLNCDQSTGQEQKTVFCCIE